jgi:hypothetical protein
MTLTADDIKALRILGEVVLIAAVGWLIGYVAGWVL